nr:uncharacterized protein si:ch211-39f2.3 isoform X2 [Danio rerio]|eukprot:XP_017214054.1 uncharacterized protein si:ch211-39f2.3 isoform X2 [Danio rerio]
MRFPISLCVSLLLLVNDALSNVTTDPCYNYESLDRPWRATDQYGLYICDDSFSWNGWYRLFYNGLDIRMPESCVSGGTCNTDISLWLNGSHPRVQDGVVTIHICGSNFLSGCCVDRFTPIKVKACPGNYYVYELLKPQYGCSAYCTDINTLPQTTPSPAVYTTPRPANNISMSDVTGHDPCHSYNVLDNYWRSTLNYLPLYGSISGYDDTRVAWQGWYRLFINGSSAQMPEWCFSSMSCGGFTSLWLGGSHPHLEDGVVTRDVYGSVNEQCSSYQSDPIQVKACPGNYYVYKLIKPNLSIPVPTYCAVPFSPPNTDPCHYYTSLDDPQRATDNFYSSNLCDYNVEWNGWYRLFYNGQSVQMPDSCVEIGMCGSPHPLSLDGSHPSLEDGVVTRQVCSPTWNDCCGYRSHPIQVKACSGNYYVYQFVKPQQCSSYCADVGSINIPTTMPSTTELAIIPVESTTDSYQALQFDPCNSYTVLDEPWRATDNRFTFDLRCDTYVSWNGWYRLFIHGQSVHMPDTCVDRLSCGTHAPLWLNGSHPQIEDGVVTRAVCGNWWGNCCAFQSYSIRVKACPENYYVYEFVSPSFCYGTYCADVRNTSISVSTAIPQTALAAFQIDPCYNYTSLDDPWRAIENQYSYNCDASLSWVGWYRLFLNGQNAQMPETCVDEMRCGTVAPLWLNGQHPKVEDGVVTRDVCGHWSGDCCNYIFDPMKVKACPGNYYVYEFKSPVFCSTAYCAELSNGTNNITVTPPTITTDVRTPVSEPCTQYSILDDGWRGLEVLGYNSPYNVHDDTLVEWSGWYRLYLNGTSAQLSEWCVSYSGCGGETGLYLNASHPKLEDGVVTRDVLGMSSGWYFSQCGNYRSNSIQVKACPGDYYVYELIKPSTLMPKPTYCTVAFNNTSNDPCYDYESLDRPWRATNESGFYICDGSFTWNGWYRLFYDGMNIRMPESCVSGGGCNTQNGLTLNGPHPHIEDGVVIREVCGSTWYSCCAFRSTPIRVKACPGDYYVYELADPMFSCSGYCIDVSTISQLPTTSPAAVTGSSITLNYDPCYNYNSLDNYWRSVYNNWLADGHGYDDSRVHWDGWYRLFINGSSAEIPEWCFSYMSCGGYVSLWLGDPHPQLEDGVVTRKVYGSVNNQCNNYRSDPIQVKACSGNYYVYKLIRPKPSIPAPVYCADSLNTPNTDPCYDYTGLDEPWRASNNSYFGSVCDYNVVWNGWYRLFYNGQSVQMQDSCVSNGMCGSYQPLWLNGSHPSLEDGVVTRQVCSPTWNDCCGYTSHPIQVKACPGNYFVYKFARPTFCSSYCIDVTRHNNILASTTAVTTTTPESTTLPSTTSEADAFDPCYNYTVLDDYWRSVNNTQSSTIRCDMYANWNGWYRLYISGQSAQMPDTCVNELRCSTHAPLWLNGEHPRVEDGVVTRSICGHWNNDCCFFHSNSIQVKACPGSYYVYEFVSPNFCHGTYCAEVTTQSFDPCFGYNVIDENWRDLRQNNYNYYSSRDDTLVEWRGWYRLYLYGKNAQLSEWCVTQTGCGGDTGLFLNGSHPRLEDGVVTREVLGTWSRSSWYWEWWWWWWNNMSHQCGFYESTSIQVKACPGDYYVYELVKPNASIFKPVYCTVAFDSTSNDPCYNYTSLDRPWRDTNESGLYVCDENFSWNGWYRLFYNGMNIRMPESCVSGGGCNTQNSLSLNGPHPQIGDGVVIREVCGSTWYGCCDLKSTPIRVKACPGDYYVYEFVKPPTYTCSGYCTDISTITEAFSSTSPASVIGSSMSTFSIDYDPCNDYNILDNYWRSTLSYGSQYQYDDGLIEWHGWYRLYLNGISAQMPEWCFTYISCGGFSSLWLGGPHPQLEDGVVTREVYASVNYQCSSNQSHPIQVKACPGNYYVYELKKPKPSIPAPTYCADPFTTPSVDPCYNYNSLDEPRRATHHSYYDKYYYYNVMCDYNVNWNGWYRLFYNGQSVQMPESCVSAGMCSTYYPLWLNGSHPQPEDGVVTREVCASSWSGCCDLKSHPIQVKACPGNYYVYEFVRPQICSAYCADISILNSTTTTNISSGPFYPFGVGDIETDRSDDGISSVIYFLRPFIFFEQTYNQVYISNNGFLTFDWPWYSYYPYQFPGYRGQDIIAPLWADIDNRFTGDISYQQYTSGSVISNATQDINQYFPDLRFSATWVFVVTWDRVPYYPNSRTETSFQVVFISDGHLSFILMNYGTVAPSHRFVQAGYDTINSKYHFSIPGSFSNNITNLTYSSNVNVPGRWAFRTDHGSRGCQFNGSAVQLGDSFWSDATCQQKCICTNSGLQCSPEPCSYSQACRPAAFQYSCQNIPRQTCTVSGDPHYYTFDNQVFHFQGTCTYVLSEACGIGLPYYRIEGKNEHRGSTHVSWTRMVRVFVYDEVIELVRGHNYEARVNGSFAATPFSLRNGSIQVYQSGFSLLISTDFGLLVTYDAFSYVRISVPYDYQNTTCGLCGNYNLQSDDDFHSPSGEILSSDVDFANSWKVDSDTDPECHNVRCTGLACAVCTTDETNRYSDTNHCGILGDVAGPFAACQSILAPQTYMENCVYDLCLGEGYQPILCQALNVYATQCQQQGVHLGQWRQQGFCEIQCPEHSHFEPQGTGCPATCSNPSAPMNCPLPNQESCICDHGYILSAGVCVPEANCGCTFEGFYYAEGQSVVLDGDCGRQCVCSRMSMICYQYQCGPGEVCEVHNGVRGCRPIGYATCSVEDLGSYHTFDGQIFRYAGACGLTLARVMGPSSLPHFVLTVEKVPRGLQDFSRFLKFEAGGIQVSIEMGEGSNVKVDGQMVGLPVSVGSGQIRIYHSSVRGFVLETNFGVTVRADWPHIVRITAPSTYNGTLGGLCGNLNGDIADEFYTPDGVLLNDTQLFAGSWRDGSLSAHCEDPFDSWEPGQFQSRSQFSQQCGIMALLDGPFAECSRTFNPQQRIADCVQLLEQTQGAKEALCEALRGYTLLCQQNGVAVEDWRNVTNCEPTCPENTHYEVCGTSCPASCPSLSFPFQCSLQCQEGCQCNDGNVLNGDHCVPPLGCGCHYSGKYYQAGQRFWHGEECQLYCTCDGTTGNVHCTPSSCREEEVCHVLDGEYGCHPRPQALCSASGDPHYKSFDGTFFDFQGTCRYVLATVCNDTIGLPHFQVDARNEPWHGLTVAITVEVFVNVSGHLVHMSQDMSGHSAVEVDGETRNLPILLDSGGLSVYSSGQYIYVSTDFGFVVSYGGSWTLNIIIPAEYSGVTCGLCGNFNGQSSDDFMTPSGDLVRSADQFGASWKIEDELPCNDGCGNNCPLCQDQTTARSLCEIIRSSEGPFSFCHVSVDPQAYYDDCVFDVCLSGNRNNVLCRSIQTYASACQANNAVIYPWRESASCAMACSNNSHYELCGTDCGHTCASSIDASCDHTCSEGCFCNDGLVRSGGQCVSVERCGCSYDGFYINVGEQFWDLECSQVCQCFAPNDMRCSAYFCSANMECTVRKGHRGCFDDSTTYLTTTTENLPAEESTTDMTTTTTSLPSDDSTTYLTTTRSNLPEAEEDHCSEFNCTENEHCEKKHGVYGCSCKKNHHRSHPSAADSFDFTETCENSHGSISLSRCQLFDAGFPSDILHLNNHNCRGKVRDGQVEFYFDNNEHVCGTSLTANGTHIIYENFIVGEPNTTGLLVSRAKALKLSFSCVYLQTQTLSMDINPLESTVHKTLPVGQGTYRVRMIPYQDAEFMHPFAGSVAAEVSKRIFVEIRVDGVDDNQFASVIDTCWATPVNDPHDSVRWDLIVDRCPNPNDDTVELVENGNSTVSRFSFEMFIFTANSTKVYLHCAIHLCLLTDNHCSVNCDSEHHRREERSADIHDSAHISLGPFTWSENDKDLLVPRQVLARAPYLSVSLTVLLISLLCLLIFL